MSILSLWLLVQKPDTETADKFGSGQHERLLHKLGNLALVSSIWNPKLGNTPFHMKRKVYAICGSRLLAKVAKNNDWNPTILLNRHEQLIKQLANRSVDKQRRQCIGACDRFTAPCGCLRAGGTWRLTMHRCMLGGHFLTARSSTLSPATLLLQQNHCSTCQRTHAQQVAQLAVTWQASPQ